MKPRRLFALILFALGGMLIFLAPNTLGGLVLVGLAVVIEAVGVFIERRR